MSRFKHLVFTEPVRAVQREQGSGRAFKEENRAEPLTGAEAAFIQERDGCYLATVGETGWPYIQHRGGPPGFVHVLDEHRIAFADVRGNRQYVTTGNLRADDRIALIFMDYPHQRRLKVLGRATELAVDADPALAARLTGHGTGGRAERLFVVRVEGFDWNCPQHITPRFSEAELAPVWTRLDELEQENADLRAQLLARE
ncbi:pyridoxamine 5'-phosphate oxidase family protein [Actinokineospora sp. G85]|uniref:pyridoxamine 5'-phosphate oxidase family protein n=1 Tax=Actinokineospora sp. G85 TaxID=3406626 RepID=UPI003C789C91